MRRRVWATALAFAGAAALSGAGVAAGDARKSAKAAPAADAFGLTKVWDVHLEIPAKDYEALQPAGWRFPGGGPGGPPGGPGPPGPPAAKAADKPADTHRGSGFGVEFPWVHGTLTAGGTSYPNVGVRYKGNASYMASSRGLKRNFKIDLDHYGEERRFHGQKSLNLNAGAMDPTKMREALSFAVFRAAGVPAPRTAYARVTLTVPGMYDRELLGLYTLIEQVDKAFLKDRFGDGSGLLMKPERLRGVDFLGDDWGRYKAQYQPKREASEAEAKRVIEFARLVNRAGDEQFRKDIGAYLDVDEFLRFVAANALLANLDSLLVVGHNYYLYLHPRTNQFVFIPWDMDLSFAGFPMAAAAEQQMDLSLTHPHAGANKLIDRLLAVPEVRAKYLALVKELAAGCFAKEQLLKDIDAVEQATKDVRADEAKAAEARKEGAGGFGFGPPGGGPFGRAPDLRTFVAKRTESIAAQLAGTRPGKVPGGGFGPGGPGRGGPGGFGRGGFGPGMFLVRPVLEAADTDRDGKLSRAEFVAATRRLFRECDRDNKGTIDEKALAEAINRLLPRPLGFGGGPPPGPPGGGPPPNGPVGGPFPGGGPGDILAGAIFRKAEPDADGKLTQIRFVKAAEAFFQECDKDKNGSLDETELADGLGRLMPQPPQPAGGRPGRGA